MNPTKVQINSVLKCSILVAFLRNFDLKPDLNICKNGYPVFQVMPMCMFIVSVHHVIRSDQIIYAIFSFTFKGECATCLCIQNYDITLFISTE